MTTPLFPPMADSRSPIRQAPRKTRLLITLLATITIAVSLAVTLYFHQSEQTPLTKAARSGLSATTFAKIPIGYADQDVEAAVEQTSSDARVLEQLSPEEARIRNATIAAAANIGPAAQPLTVPLGDGIGFVRALDCMTTAIYYEAANEPLDGQRAVAQVIINRSRHVVYPHSICAVVYQGWERKTGCQFSFTCDGSLRRAPIPALWQRARRVANMALAGLVYAPVGLATHYHADYVLPYWAPRLVKQTVIGRHIFYRWPGAWGTPRSFVASYDTHEPNIWGDMQSTGIAGLPTSSEDAETPLPVDTSSRPVLTTGGAQLANDSMAAAGQAKNRVYMISRNGSVPARAPAPAPPGRGVTGGVIMPGSQALPIASPSALPHDTQATEPGAAPPKLRRN